MTIRNTSSHQIDAFMQVKITDNASITVYTDPKYRKKLSLGPGETFRVNQTNYDQVVEVDHLVYKGITKDQIMLGNIPEEEYYICIAAYDAKNNPLSADEPQGCSAPINIKMVEPPVIVRPECNANISPTIPQAISFSWTQPVGAPSGTQYTLKFVELLPSDRNAIEAIQSPTHAVFFEKTASVPLYMLGPSDPQLVSGKKYAFAVTAADPNNQTNFKNNGNSDVCSFTYGVEGAVEKVLIELITPVASDSLTNNHPSFTWRMNKISPDVRFTVTVYEVLEKGDTTDIQKNLKTFWTKSGIKESSLNYPSEFTPIETNKSYVWKVAALDMKGVALGQSEVGYFGYSSAKKQTPTLPWTCSLTPFLGVIDFYKCCPCEPLQGVQVWIAAPSYIASGYTSWEVYFSRQYRWFTDLSNRGQFHNYPVQMYSGLFFCTLPSGTVNVYFEFKVGLHWYDQCRALQKYTIHFDGLCDAKVVDFNAVSPCTNDPVVTDICEGQTAKLVVPHLVCSNCNQIVWTTHDDFTGAGSGPPWNPFSVGNPLPLNPWYLCAFSTGHYTRYFKGNTVIGGCVTCENIIKCTIWCSPQVVPITTNIPSNVCCNPTPGNCAICINNLPLSVTLKEITPPNTWTKITWTNNKDNSTGTGNTFQYTIQPPTTFPYSIKFTATVENGPINTGNCKPKSTDYTVTVYPKLTGTISSSKTDVCLNKDAVLTLSGLAPNVKLQVQWQYKSDNGSWTNVATVGDGTQQQTNEIGPLGPYIPPPQQQLCWRAVITNPAYPCPPSPCASYTTPVVCINIIPPPCDVVITNCPTAKACLGTPVQLNTALIPNPTWCQNAGLVYAWQRDGLPFGPAPSPSNTSLTVNGPGKYKVFVSNVCESKHSPTCKVEYCIFDMAIDAPCCSYPGSSITLTAIPLLPGNQYSTCGGPYSFAWNVPPGFNITSGANTSQIVGTIPSNAQVNSILSPFSVTVTDHNNCSKTISVGVLICAQP